MSADRVIEKPDEPLTIQIACYECDYRFSDGDIPSEHVASSNREHRLYRRDGFIYLSVDVG